MSDAPPTKRVAVVGGGLVGGTAACILANRGFQVDIYESRADIRTMEFVRGRSINLALSKRGRDALDAIGLEEKVVGSGVPMHARMIHDLSGALRRIPYGKTGQCIMSIDRRKLNEQLLDGAESFPNVNIHFEHKILSCDFDTGNMTFQTANGETVHKQADLLIGCDGAFSSVRRQIAKSTRFDFSQQYIPHGYMELSIPAKDNGDFAMDIEFLHIWPRNEFMMIALPNNDDNSFVVTLFMPFTMFDILKDERGILDFFEKTFPDAIPLIRRDRLVKTIINSKPLPMVQVKCSPYHVGHRALIMGDAAHAMVPFYGQGMNCGLEDVLVFRDLLDKYDNDFTKVVPEFTPARNEDAKAMCDLAMYNYVEMRKLVNSTRFLMRKKIDNILHSLMPSVWVPLYTMVSFTRTPYSECIRRKRWQDKVLHRISHAALVLSIVGGAWYAVNTKHGHLVTLLGMWQSCSATLSQWTKQLNL